MLTLALPPSRPSAQDIHHEVVAAGLFEGWLTPELGGHGALLLAWRATGLPGGASVDAGLNTETLWIGYRGRRLGDSGWRIGAELKGEALLAGLLYDYYRAGLRVPEAGFAASYVAGELSFRNDFASHHTFEGTLRGRRWFFAARGETGPDTLIPPDYTVFEPRLSYRFWDARVPTHAAADSLRPTWRFEGYTLGVEAGADLRAAPGDRAPTDAWGIPGDPRNAPSNPVWSVRQWFRAGWPLAPRVRLQLTQSARLGAGDDDVSRERAGGSNPYVVPVAGLPWAAFLVSDHVSAELSLHVVVGRERDQAHELGVVVDASLLRDRDRVDSEDLGAIVGTGLFADLRWDRWFLELRVGYSPDTGWQADPPHTSALVAFGTTLVR